MMNFRTVTTAIQTILGNAAAGRFRVVGYEGQGQAGSEVLNSNRSVQVFYNQGDFSKSSGRQTGSTQHAMAFEIGLSVSAKARLNLAVINNPASTAGQIASAMSAMQEASYVANNSFDELADIVYQILMDGRNFDLGLSVGTMSNRWIDSIKKDNVLPQGELVVLTGAIMYSCNTVEEVVGDTGTEATGGIGSQLDIYADDVERTGINT